MKSSRFQTSYRQNASALHKKVGEALKNSPLFNSYRIYQEYPVNRINPTFPSGREKYDWVILDLKLVIEVHGEQHYRPCSFGIGQDGREAYLGMRRRDLAKEEACWQAGYTYIAIPYLDIAEVNDQYLWNLYKQEKKYSQDLPPPPKKSGTNATALKQARQYRKTQYRRRKRWLAEQKRKQNGV